MAIHNARERARPEAEGEKMNAGAPAGGPEQRSGTTRGIVRWLFQIGVFILILAASLFLSAGRLDWTMGWVYVGTFVALQGLNALVLIPTSPLKKVLTKPFNSGILVQS